MITLARTVNMWNLSINSKNWITKSVLSLCDSLKQRETDNMRVAGRKDNARAQIVIACEDDSDKVIISSVEA